jgi:hypothetical protein
MPRRVGDDEFALFGREEAIGDVDSDALFALGGEAVDEEREVDLVALRADFLRVRFKRGELVFVKELRIVKEAPDQRRLAVVDGAAGDEPQHRLFLVRVEISDDVFRGEGGGVGHGAVSLRD